MGQQDSLQREDLASRIESLEAQVAALRAVAFHILSLNGRMTSERLLASLSRDVAEQRRLGAAQARPVVDAAQSLIDHVMSYDIRGN